MSTIKWQDLLDYINSSNVDLDSEVLLYDHSTGEEYDCILLELNEKDKGWVPTIAFNVEEEMEDAQ
jgi:hypothetical protein